jgi:hypothetical protein
VHHGFCGEDQGTAQSWHDDTDKTITRPVAGSGCIDNDVQRAESETGGVEKPVVLRWLDLRRCRDGFILPRQTAKVVCGGCGLRRATGLELSSNLGWS